MFRTAVRSLTFYDKIITLYTVPISQIIFDESRVKMKRIVLGLLAHVDAGKTTLSEALLYNSGSIRRLGRVDHRDSFLDTYSEERERGITIFSKQAVFEYEGASFTLLDTPGHVDFSAETERTLSVLDYAVLIISGSDGIQSHTMTLWELLSKYRIPCFIFVNKMDLAGTDKEFVLRQLQGKLGEGCIDFSDTGSGDFFETAAAADEELLDEYCSANTLKNDSLVRAVQQRKIFPCMFGSALKNEGVVPFMRLLSGFSVMPDHGSDFGAKVFKIAEDKQGQRLTFIKVTGGSLGVRNILSSEKNTEQEKVQQIRIYSGEKFTSVDSVCAGTVCALTGIRFALPGDGLGTEESNSLPMLVPVMTYSLDIPEDIHPNTALTKLRSLEDEDPQLHISWNERCGKIQISLMGEVQAEVLKNMISERFGFSVRFSSGSIIYKETIADTVEGVGHFEPLRHYAEVHLVMRPLKRGSGLVFRSECSEDLLSRNWQRLILTHLYEKTHVGVLTGSPITDMEIILTAGKAHLKHTEGGDFRQAVYRAVRQGLMCAKNILLEPYYEFRLEIPSENIGRAITDIQRMNGSFDDPVTLPSGTALLTGQAPVSEIGSYASEVIQYTHGKGRLSLRFSGYRECHDADRVISVTGYDPERDTENPCDSVFCSHGAGYVVKWDEVKKKMHLNSTLKEQAAAVRTSSESLFSCSSQKDFFALDKELIHIFESTYGPIKRKKAPPEREIITASPEPDKAVKKNYSDRDDTEYVLVDGYNVIFSWDNLKKIAEDNIDAARAALTNTLCNYQGFKKCTLILVFDAYKVKGQKEEIENVSGISIVYTKEAETADMYIEKVTHRIARRHRVRVVTSDRLEQLIILGNGALRISSSSFLDEVRRAEEEIRAIINNGT